MYSALRRFRTRNQEKFKDNPVTENPCGNIMASQEGRSGGGVGSPLGPDSTWSDSEMSGQKMEARFAQMEARILKNQDEKLEKIIEAIGSIKAAPVTARSNETSMTMNENTENLIKIMTEMKVKVDLLLGGENEANKLIDSIASNVDKTSKDLKNVEKHLVHKMEKIDIEVKKLREDHKDKKLEDLLKDVNHSAKRTRDETHEKFRDIKAKLDEMAKTAASPGKKCRSRSVSSDHGQRRDRHGSNGSSRSRSRRRGRGKSREDSITSLSRSKTELEVVAKLDGLITDVADFRKETAPRKQLEDQMLSNIIKVAKLLEQQAAEPSIKIPSGPSRWEDDDRSPSPPSKRVSRSPLKVAKLNKDQKKKKKRARSASSSSSSSSEERGSGREMEMKPLDVMVGTLAKMEEKIKEISKGSKKSNLKVEDYCKSTQERVGEMVLGVQVIAENLDSINDVARKMENLEKLSVKLDKLEMLSKLDKLDRVDRIADKIEELSLPSHSGQQRPGLMMRSEDLGWEEPRRPETEELERKIESRFCEFTGLIEDFTDKLSRKMDSISSDNSDGEDVRDIRRILRRLEEGPGLGTAPPSAQPNSLSDYKASQLERQMSEISPKLDDLYIRVLPILEDIKKTQRREAEKENVTIKEVRESQEKMDKVLFMVEDLKEEMGADRGPGSLDRRINSAIEMEGVVHKLTQMENSIAMRQNDCLNALVELRTYTAKQSSVDQILKQKEDIPLGSGDGADNGRIERRLYTQLEFMKKQEKSIERLIKNSESDAKLLSQSNMTLQGMKSAVTANGRDVLVAISSLSETVDGHTRETKTDISSLGKILNEIGGQIRNLDNDGTFGGEEAIAKLQVGIEKLSSNMKNLEKSGKVVSVGGSRSSKEVINTPSDDRDDNSGDKLDTIQSLMTKQEAELLTAINGVTAAVTKSERGMGNAMSHLAKLLKTCVDIQKNGELEKNVKECIETNSNDIQYNFEKSMEKLEELVSRGNDNKGSAGDNHGHDSSTKIDSIVTKLEKLNKNVVRIKYLVEDGSDDEDQSKRKKSKMSVESYNSPDMREIEKLLSDVSERFDLKSLETRLELLDSKLDQMSRANSEKKIEDLLFKINEIEESISRRIEDDLSANVEKVEKIDENVLEIKNIMQEVGDRMITARVFTNSQQELRKQLAEVQNSIGNIPDDFGSQAAAMEENLCANVENTVKDVFKQHWEELMNEIDQILGKLGSIKRFVKARSREGSVEGGEGGENPSLESVVHKLNDVAEKLSGLQGALETGMMSGDEREGGSREQLGTALLLTEIRKRADVDTISKLKKEMFTAVHNVQKRLLEEQFRFLSTVSESKRDSSQPTMLTLVECLNKVRESQNLIVASQNSGLSVQANTNKILADVVANLEQTHNILDRFRDGATSSKMTSRLGELCDDLGKAVTGLMSAQDQLSNCSSNNMQQLDKLIKSASTIMREDTWNNKKRVSVMEGGPTTKRRTGGGGIKMVVRNRTEDSSSLPSPSSESGQQQEDWEPPEVRQPTVRVRQAILSPQIREELRRSIETNSGPGDLHDDTELRDEFISPEKAV